MSEAPLDIALKKLALLEQEVSTLRKGAREPQFDFNAFRQAFVADPVGTMTKAGIPTEHITRVLVANAMGDQAPPELKALAAMGPQMNAAQALTEKVESLSRQFSDFTSGVQKRGKRESFQALIADKTKYPSLSKVAGANPDLFSEELEAHGGTAEEFAAKLEKMFSVVAPPPASDADAGKQPDQSPQVKPADTTAGGVPHLSTQAAGVLTKEADAKLKAEILKKYESLPTG